MPLTLVTHPDLDTSYKHEYAVATQETHAYIQPDSPDPESMIPLREWVRELHEYHRERLLAFAMGLHARMGGKSLVKSLSGDVGRVIMVFFFELTPEMLERQNGKEEECAKAREAADGLHPRAMILFNKYKDNVEAV